MPSIAFPPDDTTSSPFAPSQTNDGGLRTKDPARATRNRLNAARSTGPRTPAGKARSAQNARTHNLTAATPPPNLLADPTYRQAKQELVDELRPTTPMQQVLVSQLAHLTWQLDQVPKLEHQVLAAAAPDAPLQDSALSTPDLHNRLTALHLLQNTPTPLTRLWDHHRRLLTRTQSLLRQLLHLQRHQHDPPGPDAAPESPRARRQRADDRAALDAELRRIHHDNQRKADQARRAPTASEISNLKSDPPTPTPQITPNPANARQTTPSTTPAQNEPTPLPSPRSVSSVSSVVNLLPATQQSATPRNAAQQNPPPAQNEPRRLPLILLALLLLLPTTTRGTGLPSSVTVEITSRHSPRVAASWHNPPASNGLPDNTKNRRMRPMTQTLGQKTAPPLVRRSRKPWNCAPFLAACLLAAPLVAQSPDRAPAPRVPNDKMVAIEIPPQPDAIELGTGPLPGATAQESWHTQYGSKFARNVTVATLTPYLPDPANATGAAVIVAPGGGFRTLSMENEGSHVARALADKGVAAFVLKYRLNQTPADLETFARPAGPRPPGAAPTTRPSAGAAPASRPSPADMAARIAPQLADANAAFALVRKNAEKWHVDPDRIGMIGFSAGAMLTMTTTLSKSDAKPAFIASIYGGLSPVEVPPDAPPLFAAIAADDPLFPVNFGLIESWRKANRPVELHYYERGGHGFGMYNKPTTSTGWFDAYVKWLGMHGYLKPKA